MAQKYCICILYTNPMLFIIIKQLILNLCYNKALLNICINATEKMNDHRKKCLMIYKKNFAYIKISFLASHTAYELALFIF